MEHLSEHFSEVAAALAAYFEATGGHLSFGRRPIELIDPETGKAVASHKVVARDRAIGLTNALGRIRVPIRGLTEIQVFNLESGTQCEIRLSSEAKWGYAVQVNPALMFRGEVLRIFVHIIHA